MVNVGGNRPGGPYQYIRWAKGPVQGRTPPRPGMAKDKWNGLLIPWNMISTKIEIDNGRNENI